MEEVGGQKLLQLGVRMVQYPAVKGVKHRKLRPARDSGAVLHQVDYLPQFSESPIPQASHIKQPRQFTEIRDFTEADYHSSQLSTIKESSESREEAKGPPLTVEELTSSLPQQSPTSENTDELRELKQFRLEVTQSLPDLVPWEERYALASQQLRNHSEEIEALKAKLAAKDQELESAHAKLSAEVRDRETIATLRKLVELDKVLTRPAERRPGARAVVGRRQVGLRYKVPM
jgi:hypothetical protein